MKANTPISPPMSIYMGAYPPAWFVQPVPTPQPMQPKTYNLREVAKLLGVGITTTRKLIDTGELPSFVVRRRRLVRRESLEKYLDRREAGKR